MTQPRDITLKRPSDASANLSTFETFQDKQTKFDTSKWVQDRWARLGSFIIARIKYEDFPEYNGTKILVWKGLSPDEFEQLRSIDPTFDPQTKLFAIFKPTKDGWNSAINMARITNSHTFSHAELKEGGFYED